MPQKGRDAVKIDRTDGSAFHSSRGGTLTPTANQG